MSRPALGPRRAGPLRLHLERQRDDRGLRVGPGHRHPPAGHRPRAAARTPPPCTPDGATVWWFADTDGDEFGHWVAEPFGGLPAGDRGRTRRPRRRGRLRGRARRSVGRSPSPARRPTTAPASGCAAADGPAEIVYEHEEDAGVGALSEDETLLVISHSEHGDSRHPALRVLRVADGSDRRGAVRRPGQGPRRRSAFSPVAGDQRAAAWCTSGAAARSCWSGISSPAPRPSWRSTCPASCRPTSPPTRRALLVWHTHAARTRLYRYDARRPAS